MKRSGIDQKRLVRDRSTLNITNMKYTIETGKFGQYVRDNHEEKDLPLDELANRLNDNRVHVEKLTYEECRALSARCQDRMDRIDADERAKIDVTPEEYHTLVTRGKIAATKQIKARTNCRLRIAILAVKDVEGSLV